MNFKNFKNKITWLSSHSLPDCQPAVRPGCARCRALKITQNNRLLRRIYETVVPKTIFLLRHGEGEYKQWNGLLEWNTGLDYWNDFFNLNLLFLLAMLAYSYFENYVRDESSKMWAHNKHIDFLCAN